MARLRCASSAAGRTDPDRSNVPRSKLPEPDACRSSLRTSLPTARRAPGAIIPIIVVFVALMAANAGAVVVDPAFDAMVGTAPEPPAATERAIPPDVRSLGELATRPLLAALARSTVSTRLDHAHRTAVDEAMLRGGAIALAEQLTRQATWTANNTYYRFFWFETIKGPGDLNRILRRFDLTREDLEQLNPAVALNLLAPGDRVLIYRYDPENPPRSRGAANRGSQTGAMPMPEGPWWWVRNPVETWGTPYTVTNLYRGLYHVGSTFPDTGVVAIGDISLRNGGRLPPHRSHRSGRDVDVSYYCHDEICARRFWDARSDNLDIPRQWELFRFWIEADVVDYIFVDSAIQKRLYEYAQAIGHDTEWLNEVFEYRGGRRRSIIRHVRGHADHFHVRFRCSPDDVQCRRGR